MTTIVSKARQSRFDGSQRRFWLAWILANGFGELVGLGVTALAAYTIASQAGIVATLLIMVILGAIVEGVAVGSAQWLVLRARLSRLNWSAWSAATAVGAGAAWLIGMLPTTLLGLAEQENVGEAAAPSLWLTVVLAALLGLAAGPILGVAQWWVLRGFVPAAGWWLPANGVAWAIGMPIVFLGANSVAAGAGTVTIAATVALTLLVAGMAVGAIHGVVLLWLLNGRAPRLRDRKPA